MTLVGNREQHPKEQRKDDKVRLTIKGLQKESLKMACKQ